MDHFYWLKTIKKNTYAYLFKALDDIEISIDPSPALPRYYSKEQFELISFCKLLNDFFLN
jgi:hypothetical protein